MDTLHDKIIVVAGAAGGIGSATARHLTGQGATVVLAGRKNPLLTILLEELRVRNSDCEVFRDDLTNHDAWCRLAEFVHQRYGRLDALIHTVGILSPASFLQLDEHEITQQINSNFTSVVYAIRGALPLMHRQRHGSIVIVGSLGGIVPMRHAPLYSATKSAVRSLCFSLFEDLRSTGISVSLLSPGPVQTRMLDMESWNADAAVSFINTPIDPVTVASTIAGLLVHPRREVILPRVTGVLSLFCNLIPGLFPLLYFLLRPLGQVRITRYRARRFPLSSMLSEENSHVRLI